MLSGCALAQQVRICVLHTSSAPSTGAATHVSDACLPGASSVSIFLALIHRLCLPRGGLCPSHLPLINCVFVSLVLSSKSSLCFPDQSICQILGFQICSPRMQCVSFHVSLLESELLILIISNFSVFLLCIMPLVPCLRTPVTQVTRFSPMFCKTCMGGTSLLDPWFVLG